MRTCASGLREYPGMTSGQGASVRAHPIAVETVGHAVAEMHQRRGAALDVLRIEHCQVAAVLLRAPDHREQPAVALGGVLGPLDEDRLGDSVACGEQIVAA